MICAFCLIVEFSLSGIPVKAAEPTPKVTYTVTGEATVGKQITINLNVSNISGLYGGSWDFAYDPSILKIDEITSGELTSSIPQITTSNKSGHAYFWFTKTGDTTGVSTTEAKSIAKIKATVLKEGTININTTNSDNSFGANNKSSLVKLSDKNGDKISYSSEDKSISCVKPVVVLQPGTYQENHAGLTYKGSWSTRSSSNYDNGSLKLGATKGSSIEFKFNGTSFEWYGTKAGSRGAANIYIDGEEVKTVDAYASSTSYIYPLYKSDTLTAGTHTVKIVLTGTKNPASSNIQVDIDKIVIKNEAPTLSAGTYQENHAGLTYKGSWSTRSSSNYDNGSLKLGATKGSSIEFKFNGTSFEWYGTKAGSRGAANIYIDGEEVKTVDAYASSTSYIYPLYKSDTLTAGTHTVKIVLTGTKNPASSNIQVDIDKIVIKNNTKE